jgi:hypothetical protein
VVDGPGSDRMTVSWDPYTLFGLVGFRLYMSNDGATGWVLIQDETALDPNITTTEVTGLAPGDTRYFRLTAIANGEGPASNVLSATIPPPTSITGWMWF